MSDAIEGEVLAPEEPTPATTQDLVRLMLDELKKHRNNEITDTRMRATARAVEVICQIKRLELAVAVASKVGDKPSSFLLIEP